MDNKTDNTPKENLVGKPQIALPIIAILLEILPFILIQVTILSSLALLLLLILPIAGFILGVVALCRGKAGVIGKVIAIIAVVMPALWLGFILIFFIGASTGLISFM